MPRVYPDSLSEQAQDRFWASISKTGSCWKFSGSRGYIRLDGTLYRANQVAWVLSGHELPKKGSLRRTCTEKTCVNPDHHRAPGQNDQKPVRSATAARPPGFPLSIHKASGQFCKRIRGKVYYFGKFDAENETQSREHARRRYEWEKDDLEKGLPPRPMPEEGTGEIRLRQLCNLFLEFKHQRVVSNELSPRTFGQYQGILRRVVDLLGDQCDVTAMRPTDWQALRSKLAEGRGLASLDADVNIVRLLCKWGWENDYLSKPAKFGQMFARVSKKSKRIAKAQRRAEVGEKLFTREEIHQLMEAACPQIRAMILLAINGGFGNYDCCRLTQNHIQDGWAIFPRIKTGVERRCPLWPETTEGLEAAQEARGQHKKPEHAQTWFITSKGNPWCNERAADSAITKAFAKLLVKLKLRRGRNFYALRHTFRTVADSSGDQVACNLIMGHSDESMAGQYREHVADERLVAVTEHVRAWLFGPENQR